MKTIEEWKKLFVEAINKKFGSSSQEERLAFMEQDLKDIAMSLKHENGELESDDHRYKNPNERIAGLFSNVFVLANQRDMDLEKELQKALDWYLDPNTRPSSDKTNEK